VDKEAADLAEEAIIKDKEEDIIPTSEAVKILEKLYLFKLRQDDGDEVFLRSLKQARKRYLVKKHESRK
jgi:hypothetical protein